MSDYKENAKLFLERRLLEYDHRIQKIKRRRKIVKGLFIGLVIVSVCSSTVCATVAGFVMPPYIIPILSISAGISTVLSVKFNLEGKKAELNKTIEQLDKIRHKIDYVVSCNGNFTEAEYRQILTEL